MVKTIFKFMHYGDSGVIIKYKNGEVIKLDNPNELALNKLDNSVLKRMTEIAKNKNENVLDARNDDEIKRMLEENRAKKNVEGGYWTLGTSTETVSHGVLLEEKAEDIERVMLHSDGFNYRILGLTIEDVIEQCKTQAGIEILQRRIREAEENDKYCNSYARFKKHDDMAVVVTGEEQLREKETIDREETK